MVPAGVGVIMSEALKNMKTRRSIRKFRSDMISKEKIDQIIEAGLYAANGMGKQMPIIVAVTDKEVRDRLSTVNCKIGGWKEDFDPFYGAPVVLIVLAPADWMNRVYDGSCVMENLMLAAHDVEIGSCWIHRAKQEFEMEEWKSWLKSIGVEGEYEGIGHCVLGYAEEKEPEATPRRDGRVFFVN